MTITNDILNNYLGRNELRKSIIELLESFKGSTNSIKKGIYIFGTPGSGKSKFVIELLKSLDYDSIIYDAGDVRNKNLFLNIDCNNVSNYNVLDLMKKKKRKIAIVMDEIDGMNNGDKGGIDGLIKLIRPKKTKKQKLENMSLNPILCLGNHESDKKIRELMNASHVFELKTPTNKQVVSILTDYLPLYDTFDDMFKEEINEYIQGDLRKLFFLIDISVKKPGMLQKHTLRNIFHIKTSNQDAKKNTLSLLTTPVPMADHNIFMNETERTTVSLLWHENMVKCCKQLPKHEFFSFYSTILDNICFADYIGRITFQNQIWQFNEMTSLLKTFYNNKLLHEKMANRKVHMTLDKIEFTKVLTKYSTEYNNQVFLQSMCQRMNMDKKDLMGFFQELKILIENNTCDMNAFDVFFQKDDIENLDIKRMYRFLDKNVKKDDAILQELSDDEDSE